MTKLLRRSVALLACALPLLAAACDGDVTYSDPSIEDAQFASSLGVDLAASTKTASGMYIRNLTTGTTGAAAVSGDSVFVHYTLWLSNGTQVDSNTGRESLSFRLGRGRVIPGFDEGVTGMRKGGSRQLVIPPSLGYGRFTNGPIPGNSILVFNVLLDSIK